MSETKEWSRSWEASKNPSKQRKYRDNAPQHLRKKFLNAHLAESVREKMGTRTVPLRTGDRVEVMRGDFSGESGRVDDIDTEERKVYVEGIDREAVDGSETNIALRPSNLKITKLNLDDDRRVEKYEVSEEEREEISVEPEEEEVEEEEAEGTEGEEETEEEEAPEEEGESATDEADYEDIVEGTVDEVKEAVEENDLDLESVLEAERENKDRVTLVEWLESRAEGDSDE